MTKPDDPGRSQEAHDKPKGEGLGKPAEGETKPIDPDAPEITPFEGEQGTFEDDAPTSSDVGKQTLTKADLGFDVTKEGTPPDDVAIKTPQHPDDPSAHEESEYNK